MPSDGCERGGAMSSATSAKQAVNQNAAKPTVKKAHEEIRDTYSNELFFALVGPVGAGSSRAAKTLRRSLEAKGYVCEIFKASDCIRTWAASQNKTLPADGSKTIESITIMQNFGDEWRDIVKDNSIVALHGIKAMMRKRADWQKIKDYNPAISVAPDGTRRAYIVDSLKHPAEAELFRRVYGNAFTLVGVVCDEDVRKQRLIEVMFNKKLWKIPETDRKVIEFMARDADDPEHKYGQHVTDTFHMSDFFVDNTQDDSDDEHQFLNEPFGRLIDIVSHQSIRRPSTAETAMHMAHSAALRSMCLSRQVGAALVDRSGNIVSTGTNEVPMAGGGVYGEDFREFQADGRCISLCENPECASNREQNEIIEALISEYPGMLVH